MPSSTSALCLGAAVLIGACCPLPDPESLPPCDQPAAAADVQAAQGAHSAAARFYERGEHTQSLRLWLAAYRLDCSAHAILINIGRAYEQLGQPDQALEAYDVYLERMGPEADPEIVARVQKLRQ